MRISNSWGSAVIIKDSFWEPRIHRHLPGYRHRGRAGACLRASSAVSGAVPGDHSEPAYTELLGRISEAYVAGQLRATQAVNTHSTETYW
jgi:hypothetical protein